MRKKFFYEEQLTRKEIAAEKRKIQKERDDKYQEFKRNINIEREERAERKRKGKLEDDERDERIFMNREDIISKKENDMFVKEIKVKNRAVNKIQNDFFLNIR